MHEETRNACRVFVGKTGRRPLGRLGHRFEDSIKMDHRGIRWCGIVGIHVTLDQDLWRYWNEPLDSITCWET
jgi:hypothetical protein